MLIIKYTIFFPLFWELSFLICLSRLLFSLPLHFLISHFPRWPHLFPFIASCLPRFFWDFWFVFLLRGNLRLCYLLHNLQFTQAFWFNNWIKTLENGWLCTVLEFKIRKYSQNVPVYTSLISLAILVSLVQKTHQVKEAQVHLSMLDVQFAITRSLNFAKYVQKLYAHFVKMSYHMLYMKHFNC